MIYHDFKTGEPEIVEPTPYKKEFRFRMGRKWYYFTKYKGDRIHNVHDCHSNLVGYICQDMEHYRIAYEVKRHFMEMGHEMLSRSLLPHVMTNDELREMQAIIAAWQKLLAQIYERHSREVMNDQ